MAEQNPTVIIAHLDDEKLRKSIDSLVGYVDKQFQSMVSTTTTKVGEMQAKLNELSQIKVDSNGSADGGSSKRARAIQSEKQSLESLQMSYDKLLGALQMAQRQERVFAGKDIWTLTREELDKYSATLQRVSELEKSLSAIRGQMSLAMVEKGQFAPNMKEYTDGLVRTSDELKKMSAYYKGLEKDAQRAFRVDLANAMKMPTTTIDEIRSKWVALKRLIEEPSAIGVFTPNQIANAKTQLDDLWGQLSRNRALQEQINADTQQQIVATNLLVEAEQKYGVEIAHTAQYFRESAEGFNQLKLTSKDGFFTISNPVYNAGVKSIEEQLVSYKAINQEANLQLEVEKAINIERQKAVQAAQTSVTERQRYNEQRQLEKTNIGEYDQLRATIASVIGVEKNQVRMADIENDSYKALSATLKQLKEAYNSLQSSGRKSETGETIIAEIQAVQHGMQEIQKTMSRPVSLNAALNLPEKTIDQITYKVQMLRSYIQNLDVVEEHGDIRKVEDAIERLNQKSKDAQQSTRKILEDVNQIRFDNISKMPTDSLGQIGAKIKEVRQYINGLKNQPVFDEKSIKRAESLLDSLTKKFDKLHKVQGTDSNVNSALRMQANTLNEIAEKTQRLQAIRANLDSTKQTDLIQRVNNALRDLGKRQDEIMGKNQQLMSSNDALGRSWNYMKNRLAFYFTVGASTQFVKQLIDIRGQYELLERSIGILIDSAQNGSRIFAELNSMALKSPFTTMELGAAAKQLVAYDVAAKDVVDTTKRLADMAAAVGVPIERLTYALGQIKSYNYLNARDARMFANTGIPLVKELADMYTKLEGQLVSTADVYDRIKKKAVSYEDVMRVVNEMTDEGGKFFNFQEKAADTLKVKIANLALVYNNMLNEIGKDQNGVLRGLLGGTKTLMENWRSIYNSLLAIVTVLGVAKAIQLVIVLQQKNMTTYMAVQKVLGEGIAKSLLNIKNAYAALFSMSGVLTAGLTALAFTLAKLSYDYYDLVKENEAFNDSIVKGAEENIKSIEKFLEDYRNELANIAGADKSDQQKMWEKVQDEIETTIKNAKQYLDVLNEIEDVAERIQTGKAILQQQEEIEQAAKDLASRHLFDMGGGFADESLAKNLKEYDDLLNTLINDYGSVEEARKRWETKDFGFGNIWQNYRASLVETRNELDNFVSKLDQVNLAKVMGSGDAQTQYANIRNFATIIRDAFLATEEGSKVGAEGQARLNAALDEWITKQGVANNLIKEREINGHKYTAAQIANIEKERTAWEMFFDRISSKDKETLDYAIDTNQTGSREVKDIWDKATKEMKENERTAYEQIESHIKVLRDTPDIVLNIIYRESYEKSTDKQVQEYTDKYLTPSGTGVLTPTEYARQKNELTKKYGKFIKKEGEDNVEWEKRLGQTYQDNKKSIESLNAQLKNSANLSEIDKAAKEDELKTLKDQQTVLEQIGKDQNFNYDQSEKGRKKSGGSKKDLVLDALKEEIRLVEKLQSDYDKLTKSESGTSQEDALATIRSAYGKTIQQLNAQLRSYGLPELTTQLITGKDPNKALEYFKNTLNTMVEKGLLNLERSKELEGVIEKFTLSAKTYNLEKITKGLNSELDKLKEEYELALELDANPEWGSVFMDLFDIDPNALPQNIEQYAARVTDALNKALKEDFKEDLQLSSIFLSDDQMKELEEKSLAGEFSMGAFNAIKKKYDEIKKLRQDNAKDTLKKTQDLQYKLGDVNEKIAIETKKLTDLQVKYQKETNDEKKRLLNLQIKDQENAIAKLGEEVMQMLPTYKNLFNSIAEHSAVVTRRIAEQWKNALENAVKNPDGSYTITDPKSGEKATVSEKEYGKQLDKVNGKLRETQSSFSKINEAFTKGEDDEIDYAKGIELVAEEAKKAAEGLRTVADIVAALGKSDAAEKLNDIATSMEGVAKAAQGVTQIKNKDYIGGASNVITGAWQAVSTWFDNSDNRISREIANSERHVKALEISYQDLQDAMEDAYGYGEVAAKRATITNKELQLVELQRQLQLEKSRKKKNQDANRIMELQSAIINLRNELDGSTKDIVNDLIGISSVGDAAEQLVSSMIDAFKNGEDYMKVYEDSFEDMIDNLIMKAIVGEIVGRKVQQMFDAVEKESTKRADKTAYSAKMPSTRDMLEELYPDYGITEKNIRDYNNIYFNRIREAKTFEEVLSAYEKSQADALQRGEQNFYDMLQKQKEFVLSEYADAATIRPEDLRVLTPEWKESWMDGVQDLFTGTMDTLGITFGQGAEKSLSNLQQGLQSMSEETGSALEAYMNGVSQQCYLQSDLLTQIRDAVVAIDSDVQIATNAQILLQLQQSYAVQMAIQSILVGWSNPSGQAVRVELLS